MPAALRFWRLSPSEGERFLAPFRHIEVSSRAALVGSRVRRSLRKSGALIGDFDIPIAAAAIEAGVPLVTEDGKGRPATEIFA